MPRRRPGSAPRAQPTGRRSSAGRRSRPPASEPRVGARIPPAARVVEAGGGDRRLATAPARRAAAAPRRAAAPAGRAARDESTPVSAPATYGELSETASTAGSHGLIAASVRRHSSKLAMPTWTCSRRRVGGAPAARARRASAGTAPRPRSAAPPGWRTDASHSPRRRALPPADRRTTPRSRTSSARASATVSQGGVFVSTRQEKSSVFSPSGPSSCSTPAASASVSASRSRSSSSTPTLSDRPKPSLATDRVHRAAGGLPRVVGGAGPEAALVRTMRGFRPTSFARCACQSRFGSSRSSQTSTRCAAVMKSATNRQPVAGQGNGSVRTQNQPLWSSASSVQSSSSSRAARRTAATRAGSRCRARHGARLDGWGWRRRRAQSQCAHERARRRDRARAAAA